MSISSLIIHYLKLCGLHRDLTTTFLFSLCKVGHLLSHLRDVFTLNFDSHANVDNPDSRVTLSNYTVYPKASQSHVSRK